MLMCVDGTYKYLGQWFYASVRDSNSTYKLRSFFFSIMGAPVLASVAACPGAILKIPHSGADDSP